MTNDDLEQVSNKEILDFIKKLLEEKETLIHVSQMLTPDEIESLKQIARESPTLVKMSQERTAFAIVFSKGKMLLAMLAATVLFIMSFLVDWKHLFKTSGG